MNKPMKKWILPVIIALVFGGGGYLIGQHTASASTTTTSGTFAGRTGAGGSFAGRTGGFGGAGGFGGGNATIGTIIAESNGSFTIQLPASTSTTAQTGTKIVLYDNTTNVMALESVPASSLQVGDSVTITGTTNSDGSVTATNIMARQGTGQSVGTGANQ